MIGVTSGIQYVIGLRCTIWQAVSQDQLHQGPGGVGLCLREASTSEGAIESQSQVLFTSGTDLDPTPGHKGQAGGPGLSKGESIGYLDKDISPGLKHNQACSGERRECQPRLVPILGPALSGLEGPGGVELWSQEVGVAAAGDLIDKEEEGAMESLSQVLFTGCTDLDPPPGHKGQAGGARIK